jgi:hypothetical protein
MEGSEMTYGGRRTHLDDRSLSRILRIVRAFAEGALVAIGFAVAILAIGIPVALVARAAGAVGLLAVTLTALARPVVDIHPLLLIGSAVVFIAERAGNSPVLLLLTAVALGAGSAFVG